MGVEIPGSQLDPRTSGLKCSRSGSLGARLCSSTAWGYRRDAGFLGTQGDRDIDPVASESKGKKFSDPEISDFLGIVSRRRAVYHQ